VRQAQRLAEFADRGLDIAEVTQDDSGGLMSYRCLVRARSPGQHGTRAG
jgi:hypothetical protein